MHKKLILFLIIFLVSSGPASADPVSLIVFGTTLWGIATAGTLGFATSLVIGAIALYSVVGGIVWGGVALLRSMGKKKSGLESSPTYADGVLQTQTNNQLPIPKHYGERTLAGNMVWVDGTTTIKKIVAFAEGPIESIGGIKLNDIPIEDTGATWEVYLGTPNQEIDPIVTGSNHEERCIELGASLRNIAYVAITVPRSEKIDKSFNTTAYVKGAKVRQYTNEDTYSIAYTRNPVWHCLDWLISYNACGIGLKNDGTSDDEAIKAAIDIQSFIEAASFADEIIYHQSLTTSLIGDNNDLIFKARSSTINDLSIQYINPAIPNQTASISLSGHDITVNLATNASSQITTTASEIISLINNNQDILELLQVYNADDNDGTGTATALSKTNFVQDSGSTRFEFDMIFDSFISIRDAIEEFKKNCRGALTIKGNKLQFKIDKPGETVKVISSEDIIRGSEKFYTVPREEHYDIIEISYASADHEYNKVAARAELPVYQNEPGIEHEAEILSITDFAQAARQAWYYLNDKRLCPYFGSFKTDYRVYDLEIGDIISLNDLLMGFENYLVKITKIIDDNSGVFEVHWRTYNPQLYSDELGSLKPTIGLTTITTNIPILDENNLINTGNLPTATDSSAGVIIPNASFITDESGTISNKYDWNYIGSGNDGPFNSIGNFSLGGEKHYTNFTLNAGHTLTLSSPILIIRCTGTATINGIINAIGAAKNGANGTPARPAGNGSGGGGGASYGTNYGGISTCKGFPIASPGQTPSIANQNLCILFTECCVGSGGGTSTSGSGGNGGGFVLIIAPTIYFTGTVNCSGGSDGGGGGGGGGGGVCIMNTHSYSQNTGTINVSGGGGLVAGASGWYRQLQRL